MPRAEPDTTAKSHRARRRGAISFCAGLPRRGNPLVLKPRVPSTNANAKRSVAGWVTSRDRLHGRVVLRQPVVEMARTCGSNTAVNGRAKDPDPRTPASVLAF